MRSPLCFAYIAQPVTGWIGEARAVLAKATEAHLQTSLKTSSVDIGEIRDLIESHLELSMSRIFASKTC